MIGEDVRENELVWSLRRYGRPDHYSDLKCPE